MMTEADTALPRLKTRPQFQSVLARPACARTPHFALHCLHLDEPAPVTGTLADPSASEAQALGPHAGSLFPGGGIWLGAMTPKRWARRAVTRNAIRRQIYAQLQDSGPPLAAQSHVVWLVRLRAEFSRKTFVSASSDFLKQAVRAELRQLWLRAQPR